MRLELPLAAVAVAWLVLAAAQGCATTKPAGVEKPHRVAFENPIDGGPPEPKRMVTFPDGHKQESVRWTRSGDTFETLTLTPSVDAASHGVGHWHGFITNGEIT